jgi:hypothetical protein
MLNSDFRVARALHIHTHAHTHARARARAHTHTHTHINLGASSHSKPAPRASARGGASAASQPRPTMGTATLAIRAPHWQPHGGSESDPVLAPRSRAHAEGGWCTGAQRQRRQGERAAPAARACRGAAAGPSPPQPRPGRAGSGRANWAIFPQESSSQVHLPSLRSLLLSEVHFSNTLRGNSVWPATTTSRGSSWPALSSPVGRLPPGRAHICMVNAPPRGRMLAWHATIPRGRRRRREGFRGSASLIDGGDASQKPAAYS